MIIESTAEYKQDRINVRNINAIILTGRCYKYEDNYYELEENDDRILFLTTIEFKDFVYPIVLMKSILENKKFAISKVNFELFVKVTEQLL
jgi:hypothetical protein